MSDQKIPGEVLGKVFMHPDTHDGYGPLRPPQGRSHFSILDGTAFATLAEDSCGNCFTVREDGAVWFWDHETDDLTRLADSVSAFVRHCTEPPPVELDPKNVKSVWINPEFAKSVGLKVPADGWVKKSSTKK